MPISTPDGKSNAVPAGESKYYKNYMTPHTSGVVPGAISTGAQPGYMQPGQGSPGFPTPGGGGGGGGGTPPPGTEFGTVGGALEGGDPNPYIQGGTPWIEQAQGAYAPSVESQAFSSFADGQSMEQMEIALADQYDKMLAQQMGQHSSQQQAAEDMLRAQAMQMGVGGSPGGALSDWAGVQSQGAKDRASIRLAHENERSNAENAMREEYTRLSTAQQEQVDTAFAAYEQYFVNTLRDTSIGAKGTSLNPEFQKDLDSLYMLLGHNNVPQAEAESMIKELTNQWVESGLAGWHYSNKGKIVYPGLGKFGLGTYAFKGSDRLFKQDPTYSGHLKPGYKIWSDWFKDPSGSLDSFLKAPEHITLGKDIDIYPTGEDPNQYGQVTY